MDQYGCNIITLLQMWMTSTNIVALMLVLVWLNSCFEQSSYFYFDVRPACTLLYTIIISLGLLQFDYAQVLRTFCLIATLDHGLDY